MASKRMFCKSVVCDNDNFLDLSRSARLLYFDAGMVADDDGVIPAPRTLLRTTGATKDDLTELIESGFLLEVSGILVVTDWLRNNNIRSDRYNTENRRPELRSVRVSEAGQYIVSENDGRSIDEYRSSRSSGGKEKPEKKPEKENLFSGEYI